MDMGTERLGTCYDPRIEHGYGRNIKFTEESIRYNMIWICSYFEISWYHWALDRSSCKWFRLAGLGNPRL